MTSNTRPSSLVLDPDGNLTRINLPSPGDTGAVLRAMYRQIGCSTVDVVRLTLQLDMWLDDDGIYTQRMNPYASGLAQHFGFTWQPYFGPVLLATCDDEANAIDMNVAKLTAVETKLADVAAEVARSTR